MSKTSQPALGNSRGQGLAAGGFCSYRAGNTGLLAGQQLELVVAVLCWLAHILVSVPSLWDLAVL